MELHSRTVASGDVVEEAAGLLDAAIELRRTLHPLARDRQRPARHPGDGARSARRAPPRCHPPRHDVGHRRTPDRLEAGADDPAARRHGRAADARGHRPRLRLGDPRADARLRARHAHRDARRRRAACCASRRGRARRRGALHVPARRGRLPRRALHARGRPARHRAARRRLRAAHHAQRARTACSDGLPRRERPMLAAGRQARDHGRGRGGHASMPHQTRDPIPVACEIVGALQTMVGDPPARRVRPSGRHRGQDLGRHDEQRHSRTPRTSRAADPHLQRDDPPPGARRHPPRRRGHREPPTRCSVEAEIVDGFPVTVNDDDSVGFRWISPGRCSAPTARCGCPIR